MKVTAEGEHIEEVLRFLTQADDENSGQQLELHFDEELCSDHREELEEIFGTLDRICEVADESIHIEKIVLRSDSEI